MAEVGEHREDPVALREGYERLRAAVLSGAGGGWRLGHGVLARRGMTGWMSAVAELVLGDGGAGGPEPMSPPQSAQAPSAQPTSLPDADQVVAVLAQMVLPLAA
ncbi:MAG: hypothetical protein ACRDL5_00700 [Solirubrobacteraceae bacterium]